MTLSGPRIGVLALQGDYREHARSLERIEAQPVLVRLPDDLADLDGLILPGGESTTMGKLASRFELLEPLRQAIDDGLPTLGTCAGMILLARATTGEPQTLLEVLDVVVERNAYGGQLASFEAPVEVNGLDEPVTGVFIRAPRIEKIGSEVSELANYDDHPVMVRQGNILATSFHPELTDDVRIHRMLTEI